MQRGGVSYQYHTDALGSVAALSDSAQRVVAGYDYDAFGSLLNQSGAVDNQIRFTGRTWNDEIGLYDYRLRWYDPSAGRFTTEDPWRGALSSPATLHRFTYVMNSPINYVDPYGLQPFQTNQGLVGSSNSGVSFWHYSFEYWWDPHDPEFHPHPYHDPMHWPHFEDPPGTGLTPGPTEPPMPFPTPTPTPTPAPTLTTDPVTSTPTPTTTPTPPPPTPYEMWEEYGPIDGEESSGGGGGGGESKPLPNIPPSYFRTLSEDKGIPVSTTVKITLPDGGSLFRAKRASNRRRSTEAQSADLIALKDIIPMTGPAGTQPVLLTPTVPFDIGSNAVEAEAVDFVVSGTSTNKGTVFITKTIDGTYDHDYVVCNRFHGYTLEATAAVPLDGFASVAKGTPWVWYTSMRKGQFLDEAFNFVVFVDEKRKLFTVDSHWLTEQYPTAQTVGHDYILNVWIWSPSAQVAYNLMIQSLGKLGALDGWKLGFTNTVQPVAPSVMIKSAQLAGNTVNLTVQSWLPASRVVTFSGYFRRPTDRSANVAFTYDAKLDPGFNTVTFPLPNPLDALVDIEVNNFKDRVYIGGASFFGFDDHTIGGTSTYKLDIPACSEPTNLKADDFFVAGCATLTGTIGPNGWAGMAITLNVNDVPTDVSAYHALTFFAKGDGKSYRVNLETEAVRQLGSTDFHQFVFTTSSEWRQFVIPFSALKQLGWDPAKMVPLTGQGVVSIAWASVGGPLDSINLSVDRVAFVNPLLISETSVLPNTADTAGPYTVSTRVTGQQSSAAVSLYYSVDGGTTFTRTLMTNSGAAFAASIPGQNSGTEVWYYVGVATPDGNVTTDPVDVPYSVFRFQVSAHPYLLVDDFRDTNPINLLGGNSGPFGADSGSVSVVYYDKTSVRLVYDVSKSGSLAGYYTLLNHADLRGYNAVAFKIKGAAGHEKAYAALRDTSMKETRILIGEYLPGGISTSWQEVIIPLVAFTSVADWSSMDNFNIAVANWIGSGAGTLYLTSVRFVTIPKAPIIIDNFDDMVGENGVAGHLWTWTGGGATIDTGYDPDNHVGDSGGAYRISYSGIGDGAWALAVMDLAGLNASSYDTLSLSVKGGSGGEKPNLYLVSRVGDIEQKGFVRLGDYVSVSASWQAAKIPLAVFEKQGVDLTKLSYFELAFEWEKMSGTVHVDDVKIYSNQVVTVVNGASSQAGPVAPGELVTLYGTGLGPDKAVLSASMEKGLSGVTVTFNGIEAFLTYVSASQINALMPYGVTGNADAVVAYAGMKTVLFPLPVADSSPGIFTRQYGTGAAWAVNADQTINSAANPASRGGWVSFWATGQGLVDPAGSDGETVVTPRNVKLPVKVTIGGADAKTNLWAGLIYTGVLQVNVQIPNDVAPGNVEVLLTIGHATSCNGVTIAVK